MTARELIFTADRIREQQGFTATGWGIEAGLDDKGGVVSRMCSKGNCKLSTLVQLLAPLGYELEIRKIEELP